MFESVSVGTPGESSVLVVGHFKGEGLDKASAGLDKSGALAAALTRSEATGEAGVCADAFPTGGAYGRAIVVGLGERKSFKPASLRSIAASIARRLNTIKDGQAQIELHHALKADKVNPREAGRCFGEGLGLIGFSNEQFKGTGTTKKTPKIAVVARCSDKRFEEAMSTGLMLAQAANLTRSLSNTPPNIATPFYMADQAKKLAKEVGLKCDVFSGAALEKEKMIGHIEVGKASENKPCLIRLEYTPEGMNAKGGGAKGAKKGSGDGKDAKAVKPLVLIGKTLCYDTGGLSLKVNNGMVGMKRDKDGGCAVLGAMLAIATVIKPKKPVVALLAAAENSISDEAYRPDDILTYRNGVTVEITNTDAEGRLVLADALVWACEKENPSAIIDLATLTGGVVTALGSTYCGMFCEDERLRARVEAAAEVTGERVWRLPMHQEYRDMMKSPIADILNSNPNRKAHPIQGAAFLSYFVTEGIPWCHLDIAGVHVADKDNGCFVTGPTGWGARLVAEVAGGF